MGTLSQKYSESPLKADTVEVGADATVYSNVRESGFPARNMCKKPVLLYYIDAVALNLVVTGLVYMQRLRLFSVQRR